MNLHDFQIAAQRTMTDTDTNRQKQNAGLGLCGEAAEISVSYEWQDNNLLEECGDLLWYVAQMCRAFGHSIAEVPPLVMNWTENASLYELWRNTGFVADIVKKQVYHKREINEPDLLKALQAITTAVDCLLGFVGKNVADACDNNNAKLLKRHPNGFTHESANARLDKLQT